MRNYYGVMKFSREELPWKINDPTKFSTQLTSNISIGADFRGQALLVDSLYSFSAGHAVPGNLGLQAMQASLYVNVQLAEKLSVYLKNDFVTKDSYEYWGLATVLPNSGYVKFGAFQPAIGLRVDDHTSFTRYGDYTQDRKSTRLNSSH